MNVTPTSARPRRGLLAMTLPELMTASSIFVLMVTGLVSTNMFAMRQNELICSKLGANDQSRLGFDLLLGELRSCKNIEIGTGSATNFISLTNGVAQQGNCIKIIPSTNTAMWIRYFFNTNLAELDRIDSSNNVVKTICTSLTNTLIFQAADYTGTNILMVDPTNYTHNYVISAAFQFYQYQYPLTYVGSNYYYNYYRIAFKATRRAP
jgi:hypothetical protein